MSRPLRFVVPGQPLHLIQRGNNRAACFVDDQDRDVYLAALRRSSERCGCIVHAFVLMPNHIHLLVTPRDRDSASRMMQSLGGSYVRYFNRRYGRTGTLWDGRFRSTVIDSERYFLTCSRYIESNPVRAGMVTHPEHYRWSSYRSNALGEDDPLIQPHRIYDALDATPESRRGRYRDLFPYGPDAAACEAIRRIPHNGPFAIPTRARAPDKPSRAVRLRRPFPRVWLAVTRVERPGSQSTA